MKTIDEEIEAFAKGEFDDVVDGDFFTEDDVKRFVRHGVDLAQRWIPVDEELPAQGQTVLVKDKGGYFFTAHISIHGWVNNERGEYIDSKRRTITHWRQIEIK